MPIIGLTDNVIPRFQRIGKLRKGGEKTAKGYGPDLDHFRFTSERPEIVEDFHSAYGKEPRLLRVFIPQQKMQDAFPTWCELWSTSGLQHRCDGQTMFIWREGDKYKRGAQKCTGSHDKNDAKNDSIGRLDLIIPELINAGHVGYVTLETHSIHDILHISGVLKAVEESRGDLRGVEFTLRRVKEKISTPGFGARAGERSKVDKWLIKIEPAADWVRVQIESARSEALMIESSTATVVDGDTGEVVVKQLAAPAASSQQPAPNSDLQDDEEKYFGKPRTTAQVTNESAPVFPKRCPHCGELNDNHAPTCHTLKSAAKPAAKPAAAQPAQAQATTAAPARPSQDMWKRFTEVHDEAVALGINVPNIKEEQITAAELATIGKQLKGAIASKHKLAALN